MSVKGYVYLLVEIDHEGQEKHKIGISKNHPDERVKQLATGNPNEIRVLNFYESFEYKKIEKILHAKYKRQQTLAENEWFKLSDPQVLSFIEECKKTEGVVNVLKDNPFF